MALTKNLPSYRGAICGDQHNLLPMPSSRQPASAVPPLGSGVTLLTLIKDIKAHFANLASTQRRAAAASHLSKVPDVEKVEGLKQLAFPHAKHLGARHQEGPDVLQAQKLRWKDKEGSPISSDIRAFLL